MNHTSPEHRRQKNRQMPKAPVQLSAVPVSDLGRYGCLDFAFVDVVFVLLARFLFAH